MNIENGPVRYLVFDTRDGTMITPVEVSGEVISRKDRRLIGISRELEPLQAEEPAPELLRSQVGELCDPMYGGKVELLVERCPSEVGLEDAESVIVLLLGGVCLPELELKFGEAELGVEEAQVAGKATILLRRNNLPDKRVVGGGIVRGDCEERN